MFGKKFSDLAFFYEIELISMKFLHDTCQGLSPSEIPEAILGRIDAQDTYIRMQN